MQAAVLPEGGASLLQFPLVSQDPPLELVQVSPVHPTAAAGPAVATKPTTATPVKVPIAAIAMSNRPRSLVMPEGRKFVPAPQGS